MNRKISLKNYDRLNKLKHEYMKLVESGLMPSFSDSNEVIILHHGTSTHLLASILENGLLPRSETNINNWSNVLPSIEKLVYVTNKWHYFFAVNAATEYYDEIFGEKWSKEEIKDHPCYITLEVPLKNLVLDEDIFLSQYMDNLCEKYDNPLEHVDLKEALNSYGTLAYKGAISPDCIKSFTILAAPQIMMDSIQGQYAQDYAVWQRGEGVGILTPEDLLKREKSLSLNKTYEIALLPTNKKVTGVEVDRMKNNIKLKTTKK